MKKLLFAIFLSILFCDQVLASKPVVRRGANSAEVTAQTEDKVWLSPSSIPYIMAAPGTVSELKLDHNVELLSGDKTLVITDKPIQWLDPNGSDRNVTMPAEAANSTDLVFTIYNDSDGAGEDLVIRDDTPTTLITVGPGQGCDVSCDGTSWNVLNNGGFKYDAVAQSTIFPQVDDATTPTLAFGDGNSGFYENTDNNVRLSLSGSAAWNFGTVKMYSIIGLASMSTALATATCPNIVPNKDDSDTGLGHAAADQLSLIAGAIEGQRIVEANSVIYNLFGVTQQDSVTDGESNTSTTIESDGATGDNFLTTCQVGDAVLIWGGTTTADYGLYWITAVTDNDTLVIDTALSATDSDIDFYILRNGRVTTAERTWYLEGSTAAGTTPVIEGGGRGSRTWEALYTIGLDETARTMVICDAGDVDTDFGLSAISHPMLALYNAAGDKYAKIQYLGFTCSDALSIYGNTIRLAVLLDLSSGNFFTFDSWSNIELTDTNAEQSWLYIEPKYNGNNTSPFNALQIKQTETLIGSGGANLIKAGTSVDDDMFVVDNVGRIILAESSDPAALADHAFLIAKDAAGTGELYAGDAAAAVTLLSPHHFDLFEPDPNEPYPWVYHSTNKALGKKINVDMAGAIRAIEQVTGKQFIYYEDIPVTVDLEKAYKDQWIEEYIRTGTHDVEVPKVQALEIVQVDVPIQYDVEVPYQVCDENGTCVDKIKIVKQRKKIGEEITGYEFIEGEVKPKIEYIWVRLKRLIRFKLSKDSVLVEFDGKFYRTVKPTQSAAVAASETGFVFSPPKWLNDRLPK